MPYNSELLNARHYRSIIVSCLCAGIAFFDFAVFTYLSDSLMELFFDNTDDLMQLHRLGLFGLFAVSYSFCAAGGFVIGKYGDTHGRKPALLLSLLGVSVCTLLMALLPTYDKIGSLAVWLLLLTRFGQGFFIGGSLPAAWVFVNEHLPTKASGLGSGFVCASCLVALLGVLSLFNGFESTLSAKNMLDYGWRILLLMGTLMGMAAFWFVKNTPETPIFKQNQPLKDECGSYIDTMNLHCADCQTPNKPTFITPNLKSLLPFLLKKRVFGVVMAVLLSWIMGSLMTFIPTVLVQLIENNPYISEGTLYFGSVIGIFFMMLGSVFFGYLTDQVNAGKVLLAGGLFLIAQSAAFFYHLSSGGQLILTFFALLGFAGGVVGALPSILTRLFAPKIRLTSVATIYGLVFAVIGGLLPFVLGYTTFFVSFMPALYISVVGLLVLFVSCYASDLVHSDTPKQNERD